LKFEAGEFLKRPSEAFGSSLIFRNRRFIGQSVMTVLGLSRSARLSRRATKNFA
jgi:hypothetical protein